MERVYNKEQWLVPFFHLSFLLSLCLCVGPSLTLTLQYNILLWEEEKWLLFCFCLYSLFRIPQMQKNIVVFLWTPLNVNPFLNQNGLIIILLLNRGKWLWLLSESGAGIYRNLNTLFTYTCVTSQWAPSVPGKDEQATKSECCIGVIKMAEQKITHSRFFSRFFV